MPNSVLIPGWTHGTLTLIHPPPPPPPLQILISGWHQAQIDFFDKKFHVCQILAVGGQFRKTPPYFEGSRRTDDPHLPPGELPVRSCDLQQGAVGCCLSNFSTARFSRLKLLCLGNSPELTSSTPNPPNLRLLNSNMMLVLHHITLGLRNFHFSVSGIHSSRLPFFHGENGNFGMNGPARPTSLIPPLF